MRRRVGVWAVACVVAACWTAGAFGFTEDPDPSEYFRGRDLQMPRREQEKVFLPTEDRANFTVFDGAENVVVEERLLKFTLTGEQATIGWGNYAGRQAPGECKAAWPGRNRLILRIQQSGERAAQSTMSVYGWVDGRRTGEATEPVVLEGNWPQEIDFGSIPMESRYSITLDGLELNLQGEPGTRYEISWVKFVRRIREGYVRYEFTIPEGDVWRAVADMGGNPRGARASQTVFYLNGMEVDKGDSGLYGAEPVDISAYVRPGVNCVAMYGRRVGATPFLYFQAGLVMESGETMQVVTRPDGSWTYSPEAQEGWNEPGFDDAAWQPITEGYSGLGYVQRSDILPAYKGLLVLENPTGRFLMYSDDQDAVVRVRVPAGLADETPQLAYLLARSGVDGKSEELARDMVAEYAQEAGSLVYTIGLGQLEPGVYTVALDLTANGGLVESRPREPLVVWPRPQGETVAPDDLLAGLDLELEQTVDFTNPDDPHPWVEVKRAGRTDPVQKVTEPTIVHKDGLAYRETAPGNNSVISYRLEDFEHPGDFYLVEATYPDDAQRLTEFDIVQKGQFWSKRQTSTGYQSGGRHYLTGEMQTLYWIHVADPGVHTLDVLNHSSENGAAVQSVKLYWIRNGLPAVQSDENRQYLIHTERQIYGDQGFNGAGAIFDSRPPSPSPVQMRRRALEEDREEAETLADRIEAEQAELSAWDRRINHLIYATGAAQRYARYLRFIGQNQHIIGSFQYNEGNRPLTPAPRIATARVPSAFRQLLAHVLDLYGIGVYSGLEVGQFHYLSTQVNNAQVAQGEETVWLVDREGKQLYRYRYHPTICCQNWAHPDYRVEFARLLNDHLRTFGHLSHYRGAHMLFGPVVVPMYYPAFIAPQDFSDPFFLSYDDTSFRLFEQDTGVALPIDPQDPSRFEKRATLVRSSEEIHEQFRQWRCEEFNQIIAEGLDVLRAGRSDLSLLGVLCTSHPTLFKTWMDSDRPAEDLLRDYGHDMSLWHGRESLGLGRWTIGWRQSGAGDNPYEWQSRESQEYAQAFANPDGPNYVMVRTSWIESRWHYETGEVFGDWGYPALVDGFDWVVKRTHQLTVHPLFAGYHCREAFIQAIITADPNILITGFTDHALVMGHQSRLRPLLVPFASLPKEHFDQVLDTDLHTNVAIRKLNRDEDAYLYVANPGYWHIDATLTVRTSGQVTKVPTGEAMDLTGDPDGERTLSVSLDPYGLVALRVDAPDLEVVSYETGDPQPDELAYLERMGNRVGDLLAEEEIRVVLPVADREYMEGVLEDVRSALAEGEYARAWYRLKTPRYWSLWHDFLEKAAREMSFLPEELNTSRRETTVETPVIRARPAPDGVTVDGRLDEAAWDQGPFRTGFVNQEDMPAVAEIGVQVTYDDENLYVAFACADKNVRELKATAEREDQIWSSRDDVAVVFLQPDATRPEYYQLAFNTQGIRFDQHNVADDHDMAWTLDWQTAVQPDADRALWTAEAAIPFRGLGLDGPGETQWRANFHRVFRNGKVGPFSWSPGGESWHDTRAFGRLVFE